MKKDAPQLDRFADRYCYDYIEKAVSSFVAENYHKLECRSRIEPQGARLESMDIEFTSNVKTYDNLIGFDVIVSTEIEIFETRKSEDFSDSITEWFKVPCQIRFEEKIEAFRINDGKGGGIEIYLPSARSNSTLSATNDLVPVIYGENYDYEATRFLKKFCPKALDAPMPIPLEEIAETMGLPPINFEKHLSPDFSVFGRICFTNEEINVYNSFGFPESIKANRGQIFIDNDTYLLCNVGCLRNTIAHELYHWARHRLYVTIKNLLNAVDFKSTHCRVRPQGSMKRKTEPLTDEEWIELQANAISPRIIMPTETARPMAIELLKKYGYNPKNPNEQALRSIIKELSDFFKVSKQLATIRLSQFGIEQAQDIFDSEYDSDINCTTQIPHSDILREYKENENFRNAINTGLFRYAEGRFVINNPKYISKVEGGIYLLTDYARKNLSECALLFETVETIEGDYRGDGLYRKNKSGFALAKKFINNAQALKNAETQAAASQAFKDFADFERSFHKAVGSGSCFSESFNALMKAYFEPLGIPEHKYSKEFSGRTGMSEKVFRDMRNGDSSYCPTQKTVVTLCAGFDFDISIAEKLLQQGGSGLLNTDEHLAYRAILTAYRGYGIVERNDILQDMGFERLNDVY